MGNTEDDLFGLLWGYFLKRTPLAGLHQIKAHQEDG